jgi:hypothetical protein
MKSALALFLLLVPILACRSESPEAQVKRAFETCVEAVESSDPGPAIELLAPDFSGPEGMGRDEAKLFLVGILRREKVGVTVFSSRIEVRGSRAEQSAELLLTSKSGSGLLPQEAGRHLFLLQWERQKGKWKLRQMQESK